MATGRGQTRAVTPADRIQALWELYQRSGPSATLPHLAADCEWTPSADLPPAGTIRGAGEIMAYLERLDRDGVRVESTMNTCEAFDEETVVVGGRVRVVSKAALSDAPLYWVCRLRDGLVARIESYPCRSDALGAVA